MDNRVLHMPVSLLLDPDLHPSAKVVWMARRVASCPATPASTAQNGAALRPQSRATRDTIRSGTEAALLQARTGLSRHTVNGAMDRLKSYMPAAGGQRVPIPVALLAEPKVGAQAKVLYGLLQAAPGSVDLSGQFTYATLCSFTRLSRDTLKLAMAQLAAAGWVHTSQETRMKPIRFWLGRPEFRRSLSEAKLAERRLQRGKYGGEAIMQEYLSLLIDSDQFTDNARPGFLINPLTMERLELDRYYLQGVAFEYNGAQHEMATGKFTEKEVDAQRLRDLIKAGLCLYHGIHLVIVREGDLTLQGMQKKVGRLMPLRTLEDRGPLIDVLEHASIIYRASAERRRATK